MSSPSAATQQQKQQQVEPSSSSADCLPLPELPECQQGTSTASHSNYKASVSNAAGYLCHIALQCRLDVSPEVVFEIFSHPDNAAAFRDILEVGYRKVIESSPGLKRVEVEQVGELRVMWVARQFKTYLNVTEDSRDPECLRTEFTLLRSDILSRFHGAWELRPVRDAAGNVVGCDAQLSQDVLPRGVPSFFARLPVLGGLLRQVSLGTIKRLVEDLLLIVKKYKAGGGALSVDDVLVQMASDRGHKTILDENRAEKLPESSDAAAAGGRKKHHHHHHKGDGSSSGNGSNVTSFAVDDLSSDSEESTVSSAAEGSSGRSNSDSSNAGGTAAQPGSEPQAAAAGGGPVPEQQPKEAAPAAVAAAAASASAAVLDAASAGGASSAASAEQADKPHSSSSSSRHRKKKHGHTQQEQEQRPVGVMLDVSQGGHVSVVLVPGDL